MSTSQQIAKAIEAIHEEQFALWDDDKRIEEEMRKVEMLTPEYHALRAAQDQNFKKGSELFAQLTQLREEQTEENKRAQERLLREKRRYNRPKGVLGRFFSRGLGPLPEDNWRIDPTPEALATVRSYRLLAFGMFIAAATLLIGLTLFVPGMNISPASLIYFTMTDAFGVTWGAIIGLFTILVLIICGGMSIQSLNLYEGKFIDTSAMAEEQWFRMGAETWSIGQRIRSCIMFGLVHITNVYYPIASLIVVGLVGVVFMMVYLRAYKQTGSTRLATLASAKLHATYNRFAIGYMLIAIGISMTAHMYLILS